MVTCALGIKGPEGLVPQRERSTPNYRGRCMVRSMVPAGAQYVWGRKGSHQPKQGPCDKKEKQIRHDTE